MPQTIEFDGQQHEFPDDFTDADIAKALGPAPKAAPTPPVAVAPPPSDGSNTSAAPGSIDRLQSSPSLGAMGGMSTRPADFKAAGQVLKEEGKGIALGAAVVAPGVAAGAGVATQIGVGALSGIIQSKILGGSNKEAAVSGLTGGVLGGVSGAIPRASQAIASFRRLAGVAPKSAVSVSASAAPVTQIMDEAAAGGSMPKVVRDFIKRVTDPNQSDLTYEEARRFYSNASRVSADENMRLTDNMKRLLGSFRAGLHQDITANRAQFGVADQYQQAVAKFAQAKQFEGNLQTIKDLAKKSALRATIGAGAGAGIAGGYELYKSFSGGHGR